ncbi:MAG: polysaccharide deacetylase family protein, partial [Ginsengibacter sp.]
LIVRGDDMGFSHSGNEALMKSYKDGIETSIEVLVPSPWFPEAVKMLKQNPGIDVGVHLALTSEWENIKWRPLTNCSSLKDSNGYFYPMVYPNKNYPGQSITENSWKIEDVEKEFRAQIEMAMKKIPRISHISSHMGCTDISNEVKSLTKKLAKEYNIDIDLEDYHVINVPYDGPSKTSAEKIQSFLNMLNKLEPGKTYWFIDHPGIDNEELQAVYHIGYEGVAADRQGVTNVFTSEKAKALIKQKGIELIGYKDLVSKK